VPFYDSFKAFWGVSDLSQHSKFYVAVAHNVAVSLVFFFSFYSAGFSFKSWLIEINLLTHNYRLKTEKDLQERTDFGVPVLRGVTSPSSQQ